MPPKKTLLSLLSKGRYQTSEDLPTIPEMAHSYIDQVIDAYEQPPHEDQRVVGQGLGVIEYATHGASVAAPSSKIVKQIIENLRKSRVNHKMVENLNKELVKKYKMQSAGEPVKLKKLTEKESMINKSLSAAMNQYKKHGTVKPGTEKMLTKLFNIQGKENGGYALPDVTRVNISDDYSLYKPVNEQYGIPGARHRGNTFYPLHAPSYEMIMEKLFEDKQAPLSIGKAMGYQQDFNRTREGSRVINNLLNKLSIGDAPGGLVPYKTDRSYFQRSPKTGEVEEVLGRFRRAKDAATAPDSVFFYEPSRQYDIEKYVPTHEAFHASPAIDKSRLNEYSFLDDYTGHNKPFHSLLDSLRKNIDAEELDSLQKLFLKGEELSRLPKILRNNKPK